MQERRIGIVEKERERFPREKDRDCGEGERGREIFLVEIDIFSRNH